MTAKKQPPTTDTTTYILEMQDGTRQKITVPSHWQLTFGPLVPGSKNNDYNSRSALALRFWENNKDNQRAVITGVAAFRDASLPIEVEVKTVQEQVVARETADGQKNVVLRGEIREWKNPDDPSYNPRDNQFLKQIESGYAMQGNDIGIAKVRR